MKLNKETKTGIFVVLTLSAIIIVINFLRGNDLFKSSNDFISTYDNVEGLNPSSPVFIQGFKSGSVVSIKYNKKNSNYAVKINMKGEFDIPIDSKTEIYSSDILGGKSIRILMGTSGTYAKNGDTLIGSVQPDMLQEVLGGIIPLKDRIEELVINLNAAVTSVNEILDESAKSHIKDILEGINSSVANLEYITSGIKVSTPELQDAITNLNELTIQLKSSSTKIDGTLENVEAITGDLREARIKETIENLKSVIEKMQDPQGSLGKLMTTDSLHNSVNNLVNDLDSLIKKIEENPKKFLKISVF